MTPEDKEIIEHIKECFQLFMGFPEPDKALACFKAFQDKKSLYLQREYLKLLDRWFKEMERTSPYHVTKEIFLIGVGLPELLKIE